MISYFVVSSLIFQSTTAIFVLPFSAILVEVEFLSYLIAHLVSFKLICSVDGEFFPGGLKLLLLWLTPNDFTSQRGSSRLERINGSAKTSETKNENQNATSKLGALVA